MPARAELVLVAGHRQAQESIFLPAVMLSSQAQLCDWRMYATQTQWVQSVYIPEDPRAKNLAARLVSYQAGCCNAIEQEVGSNANEGQSV